MYGDFRREVYGMGPRVLYIRRSPASLVNPPHFTLLSTISVGFNVFVIVVPPLRKRAIRFCRPLAAAMFVELQGRSQIVLSSTCNRRPTRLEPSLPQTALSDLPSIFARTAI